jgi:hypothetical protein
MKRILFFTAACAAIIGALWVVLVLMFTETTVRQALAISAVVAFVVQVAAFLVVREMGRRKNVMAGWGIGIALRFGALVIFALVSVPVSLPALAPWRHPRACRSTRRQSFRRRRPVPLRPQSLLFLPALSSRAWMCPR